MVRDADDRDPREPGAEGFTAIRRVSLAAVADRLSVAQTSLYAHWTAQRGARAMPDRRDIDPLDLPRPALPYLFLTDVVRSPDGNLRFRIRLAGTAMVELAGREPTGFFVDEVHPDKRYGAYIGALYAACVRRSAPIFSESEFRSASGETRWTTRLMLPLGSLQVERVLSVQATGGPSVPKRDLSLVYHDRFEPRDVAEVVPDSPPGDRAVSDRESAGG